MPDLIHATAISCGGHGILFRGAPGSGKSDLALRCIALAHSLPLPGPVLLVADDQVVVEAIEDGVRISAPVAVGGLLEVRGAGIVRLPTSGSVRLGLVVDLVPSDRIDRLPQPDTTLVAGVPVPRFPLWPFEPSAPLKALLLLDQHRRGPTFAAV